MKKIFTKIIKIGFFSVFILILTFLILDFLFPLNLEMLNKKASEILYDKNGKIISMQISNDDIWRFKANSNEIPQKLKQSVVLFEDRYFYNHFGVNFFSIFRAFSHNFRHKSSQKVGGSTITMQVARMMRPKSRTYANKIIEIFNAFQLEFHYTKDEILTMYFNLAPYGGNIEGIKTASYFYFNKNLNELSNAQIALLSVIPKNPNKNRLDKVSNINLLKNRLINELFKAKIIDENERNRAIKEPFLNKRYNYINNATHFSNLAFKNGIKNSNLDLEIQKMVELFLKNELEKLKNKNVQNGSAVLIDNENMQVVAYVGSHNFKAKFGQNDGVKSAKNVGSTLKPFIYAKAIEKGIITPLSKLVDTQIYFNQYAPLNYDKRFNGVVTASFALTNSLNIPAVKLNSLLGKNSLFYMLKKADLTEFKNEYYGEGIALGGISLSLLDLTHFYTVFANNGRLKPLEVAGKIIDKNEQILTPQSAYLTTLMLQDTPKSYLNAVWKNTKNKPNISFKTGTSANARDLYTIAFTKKWTFGVWLGNFDGSKTDDLTGGASAAKIAFNVFDYLDKTYGDTKFEMPNGIEKQKVCIDPYVDKNCTEFKDDFVINGVDLNKSCEIYKNEELFYLIKNNFLNIDELENGRCASKFKNIKPILNNIDGKIYEVFDKELHLQIFCMAVFGDEVYIKIDNNEYEKIQNKSKFYKDFKAGKHTIRCTDIYSNSVVANFEIKDLKIQ